MNENRIDIMLNAQIEYTEKLWKEKEELKQRIDKAIKYINKELLPYGDDWHWDDAGIRYYVEILLEILGDKK